MFYRMQLNRLWSLFARVACFQFSSSQGEKARRAAERERMREEKKQQAKEDAEMRRTELLSTLRDKAGGFMYCVVLARAVCSCVVTAALRGPLARALGGL